MKFIRKLPTRINKNSHLESWGIFECPVCFKEVERQLSAGRICASCGCNKNKKHSNYGTRLYNIWRNVKQRILNDSRVDFENYGGRGITICNEWLEFIPFRDWSLVNGYSDTLVIDRMDNNKGYNCQWITHKENCNNRRQKKKNLI